ncbi:MAG: phosphoribosylformylglycinamidine synthase subunit PurQ [Candidatus Omnitrophota bacterium]
MKFGVIVFPGSNCDQDCFYVVKDVLQQPVEYVWHKETHLNNFDCLIIPGGFSYGDYLRTGAIARFAPIMKEVINFANRGRFVIGICNGFQILLEAGLLPGAMLRNVGLHFICKHVYLKVRNDKTSFTNQCYKNQILNIPIAHNEGNYYIDESGLSELHNNNQIIFQYCDRDGLINKYANPNGALDNIAGIINRAGNVLGMMPHPERSSESELGSTDGLLIFKSILETFNKR